MSQEIQKHTRPQRAHAASRRLLQKGIRTSPKNPSRSTFFGNRFQDAENKKCEKKDATGPPLQTASVSVRALIEEKIINKRITNPQTSAASAASSSSDEPQQKSTAPPLFPLTVHSSASNSSDLDTKITSFVVPAPPQQTAEKARRHSDAEAFNVSRTSTTQQKAEALADLILKRDKVSVKRTTSDPGQSSQIIQFQSADSFTLTGVTYQSEDGEYLSPSLQDEVALGV